MTTPTENSRSEDPAEGSDEDYDFSKLPLNVLLKIFKYLHKEDACVKNLTETCITFNNILESRLGLFINFDKLPAIKNLPELKRQYDSIHICGTNVDTKKIPGMLAGSSSSAQILKVTAIPDALIEGAERSTSSHPVKSEMRSTSLVKILQQLPQIKSLTLDGVRAIPPNSQYGCAAFVKGPVLSQLKEITVKDCNDEIFRCFWNVENVEHIKVELSKADRHRYFLGFMLFKQHKLESFDSDSFDPDLFCP